MTTHSWQRYSYAIDLQEDSTANKVLRLIGNNKHVLELGCAVGSMTQAMKENNGCSVVAVEIDPLMAEMAEPFCERLIIADLETLDFTATFKDERFDVVVAADVLEHLKDPWQCLEKVRALLKSEGYLVISVPNVAHNVLIAQLMAGRFPYREKGLLDRTHLRFFTRLDLEDMLLATGYLPAIWERNRVAEEQTEFGRDWVELPQSLRDCLAGSVEGQTYQFIVKAFLSAETGWLTKTRTEIEQAEVAYRRLETELSQTRRALEEYQQAYTDASKMLEERQQSLAEYQQAYTDASKMLEECQRSLEEYNKAFYEARGAIESLQAEKEDLARRLWDAQRTLTGRIVNRVRRLIG